MTNCSNDVRTSKEIKKKKKDLAGNMEGIVAKKDEFAKVVADLEARLKESEFRLKESELQVGREREASKELEEELLMYKKELDLGIFYSFKDVKDDVLLNKEDIDVEEKDASEE